MTQTNYSVDRVHSGIKLAIVGSIGVGFVVGTFIIMPLIISIFRITTSATFCINVLGGGLIGLGLSWLAEKKLPDVWPSKRLLTVEESVISVTERNGAQSTIDLSENPEISKWSFTVTKGRSVVPRGWHCFSLKLQKESEVIILYTFVSPDKVDEIPKREKFTGMISKKAADNPGKQHAQSAPLQKDSLHVAEEERWLIGAEMRPDDFISFLKSTKAYLSPMDA